MTRPQAPSDPRQDRVAAATRDFTRFERKEMGPLDKARAWLSQYLWLCPVLAIALAAAILAAFGLSLWTAILMAVLLVCPAVLVWGMVTVLRRPRSKRAEKAAHTTSEFTNDDSRTRAGGKGTSNG